MGGRSQAGPGPLRGKPGRCLEGGTGIDLAEPDARAVPAGWPVPCGADQRLPDLGRAQPRVP